MGPEPDGFTAQSFHDPDDRECTLSCRFDHMIEQLRKMQNDLLEMRYRAHSGAYFSKLLRRARVVSQDVLDDLLEEATASGVLSGDDVDEVRLADIVVRGRRPGTFEEIYVVVEVSAVIDAHDVARAARRAGLLARLRPAVGVVAGDEIIPEAETIAKSAGVWQLLDGRAIDPHAA